MKKDKMEKTIQKWIKSATKESPVTREELLIELLTNGAKVGTANTAITKAFKAAGIIATTSTSALKEAREYFAENMPEITSYREARLAAEDLTERFEINDDTEKAQKAALKIVKDAMAKKGLDFPKKIQLGIVKSLMVDYFLDAQENGDETSVTGLTDHLIANVPGGGEDATDEMKKKLKVTAGTDYNFGYLLCNGLRIDDIN